MSDHKSKNTGKLSGLLPSKPVRLLITLIVALLLFVIGIFMPMITIKKFILIKSSFSVASGIWELLMNGQYILFVLICSFSIVLPILKFWVLFKLLSGKLKSQSSVNRHIKLMHDYGRWAMLDVLVVSVLIVTVKLGAIVSIVVHPGLFVFGASVLLIMLVTNSVAGIQLETRQQEPDSEKSC